MPVSGGSNSRRHYQSIEDGSDMDLDIATTTEKYELEDLNLDDDTMITGEEFKILYNRYEDLFEVNTFKNK